MFFDLYLLKKQMAPYLEHEPSLIGIVFLIIIALLYIIVNSLLKEPARHKLNALIIPGPGAPYLSGGLGPIEFVFCTGMTLHQIHHFKINE